LPPLREVSRDRAIALDHHAAFRAVVAAAPPLVIVSRRLAAAQISADLLDALALATGELVRGFASAPGSRARTEAHQRAWIAVRGIDRALIEARRRQLVAPEVLGKAQRAIDRADVMIAALPGVLPT
jgi:hypothetical protein